MKARLRTVSEIASVKGNGLRSLQFGVQDHEARTPVGSSFGKEYMTAVIRPARLHGMTSPTSQGPTLPSVKAILVNLKTTSDGCSKCNFRSIYRIPVCLRTMRAYVGRDSGQCLSRQRKLIELRFSATIRGNDQTPSIRRPTRSRLIAFVPGNSLWFGLR